ncbi:MAG: HEAT repeat domain-containing protein [Desulfobacteraceae bacterium]|nr:HEAT repeat domain-containing protein [Desulfobacteraceae bacterium]
MTFCMYCQYDRVAQCGDNIAEILKFKKMLLSDNSTEAVDFHYKLLGLNKNKKFYQHIRVAFTKRPDIESFLLKKIEIEEDEKMQGDILHLLGRIGSVQAAQIAQEFLSYKNEYHREVALYVLGWMASREEIALLNYHMLNETSPLLRKTAASAHRQVAHRLPEKKMILIESLKQGFENEQDIEVQPWIIIMIQTILDKRLGIREDKDDPYVWHGDLNKAIQKTDRYLSTLDFLINRCK